MRLVFAILIASCESGGLPSNMADRSSSDEAHARAHSFAGTRAVLANEAILPLLKARAHYKTTDFDAAIKELTALSCRDARQKDREVISVSGVEDLYPMDRLSDCKGVVCGGCFTFNGDYALGPAYQERPVIEAM